MRAGGGVKVTRPVGSAESARCPGARAGAAHYILLGALYCHDARNHRHVVLVFPSVVRRPAGAGDQSQPEHRLNALLLTYATRHQPCSFRQCLLRRGASEEGRVCLRSLVIPRLLTAARRGEV